MSQKHCHWLIELSVFWEGGAKPSGLSYS